MKEGGGHPGDEKTRMSCGAGDVKAMPLMSVLPAPPGAKAPRGCMVDQQWGVLPAEVRVAAPQTHEDIQVGASFEAWVMAPEALVPLTGDGQLTGRPIPRVVVKAALRAAEIPTSERRRQRGDWVLGADDGVGGLVTEGTGEPGKPLLRDLECCVQKHQYIAIETGGAMVAQRALSMLGQHGEANITFNQQALGGFIKRRQLYQRLGVSAEVSDTACQGAQTALQVLGGMAGVD
ncbi:hypothetical protein GCM10027512_04820 [Chromohalobacter beijerinckii]